MSRSVDSAPSPDAKARACLACSSAARFSSSAWRVGFPLRPYSKPLCLPTPCWAKVVAMWIGCTTAPVSGSGPCPMWTARVEKPQSVSEGKSALAAVRHELEQVGAGDHRDRLLVLHDQHGLFATQKRLERVVERGVDRDLAHRWIHRRRYGCRHDRRVAVDAVEQRALLEGADDATSVRLLHHGQLRDAVALHQVDRLAHRLGRP